MLVSVLNSDADHLPDIGADFTVRANGEPLEIALAEDALQWALPTLLDTEVFPIFVFPDSTRTSKCFPTVLVRTRLNKYLPNHLCLPNAVSSKSHRLAVLVRYGTGPARIYCTVLYSTVRVQYWCWRSLRVQVRVLRVVLPVRVLSQQLTSRTEV